MAKVALFSRRVLPLFFLATAILCLAAGEEDYYKILGVSRDATTKDIKKAYRRKALDTHPDKRKDIPPEEAAAEFQRVVEAFETLTDENSRRDYDRTGRRQDRQNSGGRNSGFDWSSSSWGGFNFSWKSADGKRTFRKRTAHNEFKIKECISRVMHIISLTQLETIMLDENGLLERNLLMVFVTPGEVEKVVDQEIVYPYPFAAMSEQGIWWEDLLQTTKVRFNRYNDLTKYFGVSHGDMMRKSGKPVFLFGRRGQPLKPESMSKLRTTSRHEFDSWVWKQIEVTVHFTNEHAHPVELFWIHGSTAHDKGTLQPGHTMKVTTMLTHEWWIRDARVDTREDSHGRHKLTKESCVAVWKIKTDEDHRDLIIPPKSCIDLSGHCSWWKAQGECENNPVFMRTDCALTCKICSEENDKFKSYDHAEF